MRRFDASQGPRKLGPHEGKAVDVAGLGVRFMVYSEESGGGFALVEHPIPPRTLAGPVHRHSREDEYSYVLEGRMGALLGDEVIYAEPGDPASKPGDQWHTFWNAGDTPAGSSRSSRPAGLSTSSSKPRQRYKRPTSHPRSWARSALATGSSSSSTASRESAPSTG